jgi:hypothetical protein
VFEREWRPGERTDSDLDEEQGIIVARCPVRVKCAAEVVAVDEQLFAIVPGGDGDRLHRPATISGPIARAVIEMTAPEAVRAVVAVSRAGSGKRDFEAAMGATEDIAPGQGVTPLTRTVAAPGGREAIPRMSGGRLKGAAGRGYPRADGVVTVPAGCAIEGAG